MRQAGQRVRDHVLKENGRLDSDTIVDAAVSFDGKRAKRGFTSLTDVVFVISVDTGEVLNYHVLSKECRKCVMKKAQCENDDALGSGKLSTLPEINVILISMVAPLPWKLKVLLFCGTDPFNKTCGISGWFAMATVKPSMLWKTLMTVARLKNLTVWDRCRREWGSV